MKLFFPFERGIFNRIFLLIRNFQGLTPTFFMIMTSMFLHMFSFIGDFDYEAYITQNPRLHYDFIVVGAGSAGAAVAARLAEVENWNILLLEQGGPPNPVNSIPGFSSFFFLVDERIPKEIEPQRFAQFGYVNNRNTWPFGSGLGGGSSINACLAVRGNRRDYDRWAALGNEGWDYQSVLPYFKKLEDFRGIAYDNTAPFHATGGPVSIESKKFILPCGSAFLEAGAELGYRSGIDPNAEEQSGFTLPHLTTFNGVRASTAEAYIRPNIRRKNFDVVTRATVAEVLLNEFNKAIGVKYILRNQKRFAYASKEVILSAGAVESPKILMLSGIGPRYELEKFNIPIRAELPGVGQNLQDHPFLFGLSWTVNKGAAYSLSVGLLNVSAIKDYKNNRGGPFAVPTAVESNAWVQVSGGDELYPDLQILLVGTNAGFDYGLTIGDSVGYRRDLYDDYFVGLFKSEGLSIGATLLRPKSRGHISLRSRDPFEQAKIDPNFLSHPDDVKFFVRAIRFCLRVGETNAMKKIGAKFYDKPLMGCSHLPYGSDVYWECYARHLVSSGYHPVGTCKMGSSYDPLAVVDNRLRVRGVSGLRVIDASIMPLIPSGNTNIPSIMIGEKGADLIKADHLYF